MIDVKRVSADEFLARPETPALLAEYANESRIGGLPAPAPDAEMYRAMYASGMLHPLAAFDGETMVGFASLIVYRNPHYGVVMGVAESLFVAGAHRSGGAGLQLLKAAELLAVGLGAVGILVSAPEESRLAQVMDAKRSYTLTNRVYFKPLRGSQP
ncbi:GNAT family N-acetyltransferase [Bordetella hinzii]|uniref:GNAT family N-acetyltransferase n=1 Tax=Bordetella hinzii TaxID=103855 RepID=UPI0013EFDBAD|nr:GNAT family N-acetyltransferase [Bordetella hinzii]QII84184.1 GNAT family N-acetyltransferase [Bordetella hinzii]